MSYSCNACGFYVKTGESHSCYTPSGQTTVSQAYVDSLNEDIRQLRAENKELIDALEVARSELMKGKEYKTAEVMVIDAALDKARGEVDDEKQR